MINIARDTARETARDTRNWFDHGGKSYARFRPEYPAELAQFLASVSPTSTLALDAGCGTGQLTAQLGHHFESVVGVDSSQDQLDHAKPHPRVQYVCSAAEQLPVADGSVSLITAAQAAHWFDLHRFYDEVRRIAAPDAVLALMTYQPLHLDESLQPRFRHFYWHEIGPYWPAERALVDNGYTDLPYPWVELPSPVLEIRKEWSLGEVLGYISTWSAVRRAQESKHEDLLRHFATDLTELWGEPSQLREVHWPITMRVGRFSSPAA